MTGKLLRATPFHARAAAANRFNAWENRGGFTLATAYGDQHGEALAARFGAVMTDVSWHWRVTVSGARAGEFVARLFTRDASALAPGCALHTLWLNDRGGVRGLGTIARTGEDSFLLVSEAADADWLARAASLYEVKVATADEGVLALVGPAAAKVLEAAGLNANLGPLTLRKSAWRGLEVTLSRLGECGYELCCQLEDAPIVWDRIALAGRCFALQPAGLAAMDILALESGIVRPGRDFTPARDGFSPDPSPQSLGLASLVDHEHVFNGRAGYLTAGPEKSLAGIMLDSETPAPHATLTRSGHAIGRTLGSLYSPALRRAVALAAVEANTAPGTALSANGQGCITCALPFLPIPAPLDAGVSAGKE